MQSRKPLVGGIAALGLGMLIAVGCGGSSTTSTGEGDGGTRDATSNPSGCPSSAPQGGDACALAEGTRCSYGCEQGGPADATCSGNKWSVAHLNFACAVGIGDAGPPPAPAPFACGLQTCGVTQYCVFPCCGGAPPSCDPVPDSGVCPAGTQMGTCPVGGGTGCVPVPCTPPPPYCVDDPKQAPASCFPFPNSSKPRDLACSCA